MHPEEIEDIVNEIISIKHDPFSRSSDISVASLSSILADAIGAQAKKLSTTTTKEDEGRVSPIVAAAREWTLNPTADRYKSLKCGNADDITVVVSVVVVPAHQSCCSHDSEQLQHWEEDKGMFFPSSSSTFFFLLYVLMIVQQLTNHSSSFPLFSIGLPLPGSDTDNNNNNNMALVSRVYSICSPLHAKCEDSHFLTPQVIGIADGT